MSLPIFELSAKLIIEPNVLLHQRSRETSVAEVEELELERKIKEALPTAWTTGHGLAAIQIGIPLRFAWYRIQDVKDQNVWHERRLVNPVIIKGLRPMVTKEGCLSMPNTWETVQRWTVVYYTVDDPNHTGMKIKAPDDWQGGQMYIAFGTEAQIIQHEIMHMDGENMTKYRHRRPGPKIGRNDPCPDCLKEGKTIKYKKCEKHFVG